MSIFDDTAPNPAGNEPQNPGATDSFVKQLVASKGDQWSDPEVIAKGKIEADAFVTELERQNKELREELAKQDYAKELVAKLGEKAPVAPAPNTQSNTPDPADQPTVPSEDDLKRLVEETISQREVEATAAQNLATVEKTLRDTFGTEADAKVAEAAQKTGLSKERLKALAAESPTAFMSLIGAPEKPTPNAPRSTVNFESVQQNTGDRTFKYYQELRRKDRNLYFDPKVQKQMIQDRQRLGAEAFYA